MVIKLIDNGYWSKEEIYQQPDEFLDKDLDRQLFGLSELDKNSEK